MNTTTIKALILSTSLLAGLPLVGCAAPANENSDEDTSADLANDSDGDENVASTSSAFSVATATYSDLGWYGGSGGTSSARISCPTGSVMIGLQGRSGNVLDRVGLVCAALHSDGTLGAATTTTTRGGDGGSPFRLQCPAGEVVRGFGFTWGNYVDSARLQCGKPPFTSTAYTTDWVGGLGMGGFQNPECPDYEAVTSIAVHTGNVVDAINPRCSYVGTH